MRRVAIAFLASSLISTPCRADGMKEFIMSCTYGVLAGTLVGAASLAFTTKPGENLRNIAVGASLGLYSGMLLGAYVVWGVPAEGEEGEEGEGPGPDGGPSQEPGSEGGGEESDGQIPEGVMNRRQKSGGRIAQRNPALIIPIFTETGALDGGLLAVTVHSF